MTESYLAADGCRLFASRRGSGPALALIPGLGGSGSFWDPVADELESTFTIISFDHRGVGRSERTLDGHRIDVLAADIASGLAHWKVPRAHVIGHSTGGLIAQALALDFPGLVDRLVLSGTWASPDYRLQLLFETRLAVLERAGPDTFAALAQILGYPPSWINEHSDEVAATIAVELESGDAAILRSRIRMLLDFDRRAELHALTAPTLVVSAADDLMIPPGTSAELARLIPGAQLASIGLGGHFFPRTTPRVFAAKIAPWLDGQ